MVASRELNPAVQTRVAPSDVVQDACTRIYHRLDQFRGETDAALRAWMARIVRRRRREVERSHIDCAKRDAPRAGDASSTGSAVACDGETPSARAVANQADEQVQKALAELPGPYREVIRLRQWMRWEFSEIAEAMDGRGPPVRARFLPIATHDSGPLRTRVASPRIGAGSTEIGGGRGGV